MMYYGMNGSSSSNVSSESFAGGKKNEDTTRIKQRRRRQRRALPLPVVVVTLCLFLLIVIQKDNHFHDPFIRCFMIPLLAVESFTFQTTSTTTNNFHPLNKLQSTSVSVAYLESISYQPPSVEDGLLGATSKYLDALSSATGGMGGAGDRVSYSFLDNTAASLMNNADTSTSTSSDVLFQEVIQRVTQEFSSTLDAFAIAAGSSSTSSTSNSIIDLGIDSITSGSRFSSSTLLSVETTPSLDKFEIWKQQIEDGTWTAVPKNTYNTVTTTATKAASIISESDTSATATAAPVVNNNMNAAATVFKPISDTATKAATTISQTAINAKDALGVVATTTTKAVSDTASNTASVISEIAFNANTVLGGVAGTTSKVVSSSGQGLQNSIEGFVSTTTQNFNQVMSTIAETTSKTSSSIVDTAGSTSRSVFNGISSVTNDSMNAFTASASSVSQTTSEFVGSAAAVTKAAVITATPGTAVSSSAKITAVALAQQQGFGSSYSNSNSNGGGGDIQGLIEMIVATVVAIPRALMDVTLQDSPNALDDMMNSIRDGLYNDLIIPLSMPLQTASGATATSTTQVTPIRTSLEQAQAVLKTLQMILGLVVGIPRAIVEGITGQTITEVQYSLSQTDINGLSQQLQAFASAVASVLVSLLKVVANSIAFIATTTTSGAGVAGASASGTSTAAAAAAAIATSSQIDGDVISKTITFILEDLLPAFIDGLALILQQFIMLLMEGGSAIVSTL